MRSIIIVFITLIPLFSLAQQNDTIERVILLYIDGFHPQAFEKYNLKNLKEIRQEGTSVSEGIMTFPVHPTIYGYGKFHTTSLPNITTLAGTAFLDEKQHFFHHNLPKNYIKLHAAGSNAYRSMNDGFNYVLTRSGVKDSVLIDFTIDAFEKENDIQFSRIHLQETGAAGRLGVGKQTGNDQTIWADESPYQSAVTNADKQIGRLFSYLKAKGKWESTLIVFMGDGQSAHGWHLYMFEDAWQTPIIFYGPKIKKNYQIPYAENIDVIPTIAKLWNIKLSNINIGGSGIVLNDIIIGQENHTEHPKWTKKINNQQKEYTLLKAKADLKSAENPKINFQLMELMHQELSEHQFYGYDRIMEWKDAQTLEKMYLSNQWVIEKLKNILNEEKGYR